MLLPRNVQDLRRLRPFPALLPTHQLLQENGHQNEVGQCQKYGLSWAEGELASDSGAQLQQSATSTYGTLQHFPNSQASRIVSPDSSPLSSSKPSKTKSGNWGRILRDFRNCGNWLYRRIFRADNDFDNSSEMGL